jgi:hypothetical protein
VIVQLLQRGTWGEALGDLGVTDELVIAAHMIDAKRPALWVGQTRAELFGGDDDEPAETSDVVGIVATPLIGQRPDLELCRFAVEDMASSYDYGTSAIEHLAHLLSDELYATTLEPLRWTFALYPEWVAQEAKPEAAPLFRAQALALQSCGYSTWTDTVTCGGGIGGTQRRALLSASRTREVVDPRSTLLHPETVVSMLPSWLLLRQLVAVT